jgi:hypothetical protein
MLARYSLPSAAGGRTVTVVARFSDAQTAAIVAAQLERNLTAREAIEEAAAGELPGVPEPFSIAESTARGIAARARRERGAAFPAATAEAAGVADAATRRLAELLDAVIAAEAAKSPEEVSLERLRQAAKVVEAVAKAARAGGRPLPRSAVPVGDAAEEDDFLGGLARLAATNGAGAA